MKSIMPRKEFDMMYSRGGRVQQVKLIKSGTKHIPHDTLLHRVSHQTKDTCKVIWKGIKITIPTH